VGVQPLDAPVQRELLIVDRDDDLQRLAHQLAFPAAAARIRVPRPEQS